MSFSENNQNFVKLDNVYIDKQIFNSFFACDLSKCKGICCVIKGTLGAPVSYDEIKLIEKLIPDIVSYFEEAKLNYMYKNGFYEKSGNAYHLATLDGDDCLFSYYDSGIAKCIFQKAYIDKKIDFKKPISCDLFPVRIYKTEVITLRYEKIKECISAVENGTEKQIHLLDFISNSLTRIFGREFNEKIKNIFSIL